MSDTLNQTPQGLSEDLPQGLSEDLPQGLSEDLPQGLSEDLPQGLSEDLPQGLSEVRYIPDHTNQNPSNASSIFSPPVQIDPIYLSPLLDYGLKICDTDKYTANSMRNSFEYPPIHETNICVDYKVVLNNELVNTHNTANRVNIPDTFTKPYIVKMVPDNTSIKIDKNISNTTNQDKSVNKIIDIISIKMAARKAKLLEIYSNESSSWIGGFLTNKRVMMYAGAMLVLIYLIISQLISWIQYISEILVFTIMSIKIALHVFSYESDLRKHMETLMTQTNDMKELKLAYKQLRKIKRIRLDYVRTLLRQILVVTVIKMLITMLPIFTVIPILGMFFHYIHISLIVLSILVQIPTTILNFFISMITKKLNINNHNFYLVCPLSDKIVFWIKTCICDTKLLSIRTIQDILLKYDKKTEFSIDDGDRDRLMDSLDNLGISKEYLKSVGLDLNNMDNFVAQIKEKTNILFAQGVQLIFNGNTNISDLMTDASKNTTLKSALFVTDSVTDSVTASVIDTVSNKIKLTINSEANNSDNKKMNRKFQIYE
jgi:hypothetical protein